VHDAECVQVTLANSRSWRWLCTSPTGNERIHDSDVACAGILRRHAREMFPKLFPRQVSGSREDSDFHHTLTKLQHFYISHMKRQGKLSAYAGNTSSSADATTRGCNGPGYTVMRGSIAYWVLLVLQLGLLLVLVLLLVFLIPVIQNVEGLLPSRPHTLSRPRCMYPTARARCHSFLSSATFLNPMLRGPRGSQKALGSL
jgi:hypothetical protein